jgi:hypothetical protein
MSSSDSSIVPKYSFLVLRYDPVLKTVLTELEFSEAVIRDDKAGAMLIVAPSEPELIAKAVGMKDSMCPDLWTLIESNQVDCRRCEESERAHLVTSFAHGRSVAPFDITFGLHVKATCVVGGDSVTDIAKKAINAIIEKAGVVSIQKNKKTDKLINDIQASQEGKVPNACSFIPTSGDAPFPVRVGVMLKIHEYLGSKSSADFPFSLKPFDAVEPVFHGASYADMDKPLFFTIENKRPNKDSIFYEAVDTDIELTSCGTSPTFWVVVRPHLSDDESCYLISRDEWHDATEESKTKFVVALYLNSLYSGFDYVIDSSTFVGARMDANLEREVAIFKLFVGSNPPNSAQINGGELISFINRQVPKTQVDMWAASDPQNAWVGQLNQKAGCEVITIGDFYLVKKL